MSFKYSIVFKFSEIFKNKEIRSNYFRKKGAKIGGGCNIISDISTSETQLIEIGDNVVISFGVTFITHDNSIMKVIPEKSNLFGKIIIGNNCFIGANSTILYGVTLADDIIVAAGSVVTKSFKENKIIIAGNPAKKISDFDSFKRKYGEFAVKRSALKDKELLKFVLIKK